MKGMSFTMKIVVTIIVILVAAFFLLTIFSGGTNQAASQIQVWLNQYASGKPGPTLPTGSGLSTACASPNVCKTPNACADDDGSTVSGKTCQREGDICCSE